ncbi:glycosyltransferase family 61 protein, partial [Mycobacteroides abscessus]|uniref:glycosyltransferase family 61 protein n=1 Tax=Mycobacteroides abscessus TaxID=36809 RepID=UPI0009CFA1B7
MTTITPPKTYHELVTRRLMVRLRKGIVPRPTKWNEGRHAAPAPWPHYDKRQLVRDTSAVASSRVVYESRPDQRYRRVVAE